MDSDQNPSIWKLVQITIRLMEQVEENNDYHIRSLQERIRELSMENELLRDKIEAQEYTLEDVPENWDP
jgi:hypothetical protein